MKPAGAILAGLLAALSLTSASHAADEVRYQIRPILRDGALAALSVEMQLRGDRNGETRLELPASGSAAEDGEPS